MDIQKLEDIYDGKEGPAGNYIVSCTNNTMLQWTQ